MLQIRYGRYKLTLRMRPLTTAEKVFWILMLIALTMPFYIADLVAMCNAGP